MSIINKMYLKDSQGGDVEYDIGAAAGNVSYNDNGTQTTVQAKIDNINSKLDPHIGTLASNPDGVHGIKYSNGLKVQDGTQWRDIGGGGDAEVVDIKGARITSNGQTVSITCSDPDDSRWLKTQVRRKINSAPTDELDSNGNPIDGDFVADWTIKNTYSSTALTDSNKTIGTLYYYRFFIGLDTDGNGTIDKQVPGSSISIIPTQAISYGDMLKSTYDPNNDGIIGIAQGGTGNSDGYIKTGQLAGSTVGTRSTIEGVDNVASGNYCHAEGYQTSALGRYDHTEGYQTKTIGQGNYSHAEGFQTSALGQATHSEGNSTLAYAQQAHAEGGSTTANSSFAHAEGKSTLSDGEASHAEGYLTTAKGKYSHVEGSYTYTNSDSAHAEGAYTTASSSYSHAGGNNTKVNALAGFVHGQSVQNNGGMGTAVFGCGKSQDQPADVHSKGFAVINEYNSKFSNVSTIPVHEGVAFGVSNQITNDPNPSGNAVDANYGCTVITRRSQRNSIKIAVQNQSINMLYLSCYPSTYDQDPEQLDTCYGGGVYCLFPGPGESDGSPGALRVLALAHFDGNSDYQMPINESLGEINIDISALPNTFVVMAQVIRVC